MTVNDFKNKIKELFGEDSFDFSSMVYNGDRKPLTLICKKHNLSLTKTGRTFLRGARVPSL